MGSANTTTTDDTDNAEDDKEKSSKSKNRWDIVENGHQITHQDFLFGTPPIKKPSETQHIADTRLSSRISGPSPESLLPEPSQWVSRMYIDPPFTRRISPTNKVEVRFVIDQGQIKEIQNARAVPVGLLQFDETASKSSWEERAVSYLHLCVSNAERGFRIEPVRKGDGILPRFARNNSGLVADCGGHRVLCDMLSRASMVWTPDDETRRLCDVWKTQGSSCSGRQKYLNLLEEVRLVQHAITKFKLDFHVLDLRTNMIYSQEPESLPSEERLEMEGLSKLRCRINEEIQQLERHLAERLQTMVTGDGTLFATDMCSLATVQQVVDLLQEQLYHSSVVHSLTETRLAQHQRRVSADLTRQPAAHQHDPLVAGARSPAETSHQSPATGQCHVNLEQMRETLLTEVRSSVQAETDSLRKQVLDAEMEVQNLKAQLENASIRHGVGGTEMIDPTHTSTPNAATNTISATTSLTAQNNAAAALSS